ncbi:putative membrane protein [[Clostridium] sordellii ATCC 9714]|nr:putative membrane protein [[Clostridium] sordellii ATCC 9714] [Paeniclostridium sordellii ATCC 9714]
MFTNNDVVAFIIVPLIGNLFLIYVFFEFMGKVERNIYKHKFAYIISYIAFSIIASSIPLLGVPILSGMSIIVGTMLIGHYFIIILNYIYCTILYTQYAYYFVIY